MRENFYTFWFKCSRSWITAWATGKFRNNPLVVVVVMVVPIMIAKLHFSDFPFMTVPFN